MINVSNQFLTDIENDNRNYRMYVDITLANSTVLHLTNEDLWEDGVRIEDSVSEDSKLEVGSAIINQCIVVLNNIEETFSEYDFAEAEVVISVGLMLSTGTEERFVKGRFTVNEQNYDSSLVTLTCLDHMNRFEKPYLESSLTYPATLTQIVADACAVCNVPMGSFSLLNGSVSISERPTDTTLTFRNVLAAIGQICCANARINASGQLEYKWYDLNQAIQIPSLYTINTAMDDTVITGVRAVVLQNGQANEYKSGVDGCYVSIENNLFVTSDNAQTIVDTIATRAVGFRYRKANFTHLSDPHLEAGDTAVIQDGHGNQYNVLLSTTVFTVGNRQESVSAGSTPARNRANQYSQEVKDYVGLPKPFYTWIAYAKDNLGTDISTDPTGRPFLGIAENQTTPTVDLSDPSVFTWSLYVGADATIVSQSVSYCLSLSGTEPGSTTRITENSVIRVLENGEVRELEAAVAPWQSTVPAYEPNTYLWTKTTIVYSDGTVIDSYSVSYNQPKVDSVVSEYYLSTSRTTQSGGSWSETPAEYINGRYYWRRDKTTWNDGTIEYSDPVLEQSMISANENASTALTNANNALTTANGKNKVYHQSTAPTGATFVVGDTWFDTDDGYKMYTWDGTAWTAETFGTNALSDLAVTNAKIANGTIQNAKIATVDAGKITTGTLDADRIAANSIVIGKLSSEVQGSIEKIDNLEVGGRNLARNTGDMASSDWVFNRSTLTSTVLTMTPTTSSANAKYKINYLTYGDYKDNYFTISFDCRELATGSYGTGDIRVCLMVQLASRLNSLVGSGSDRFQTFNLASQGTEWHRYTLTAKIPDDLQTGQESALVDSSFVTFQFIRNASTRPIEIKNIKFELGTVATDWTPAPEDVDADIDDARKTATSYISTDSTGIMVADMENGVQTPSAATGRNVRVTSTAVEVRDGQDVKASFGTEVVLGDTNESKLRLGDKYVRAQDSDDNEYYEVQDLRGETITARFLGTEVRRYNNACPLYYASEIISVTVGGTATTAYTLESDGSILYLTNDPQDNDIVITYKTSSTAPAFTFGTRGNEAQGIFSATFGQDNIASALHSFASGHATEATQEAATAEGAYSKASGYASHAQNYGTVAPNAYETAIGKYNKAVDSPTDGSTILFYIGNGTDGTDRHNALTVDENGNIETNEVQSILSKLSNSLSAVDLNDITEPGNYSVAASTAITNTPFSTNPAGATSPAFSLMVFNSRIVTSTTSETVVLQVAWSKDAGAVRARIYQSLTWSAWQTLMSTSQPTFSRNTTNTSAVTMNLERVGDMVVGTFRATTRIQFTASTTYSLGTLSPAPVANSVFFARSGDVFNVQGWVGVSDGGLYVQSGTALAANKTIEGMFIYHPVQ